MQPLVFGHYFEINARFKELIDKISKSVAFQYHREKGWKNAKAGIPRARAGVTRRISMAVLRATARHVLRGLDIIGPKAMHTHIARRERAEAAKEFDHDEFRTRERQLRGGEHARSA